MAGGRAVMVLIGSLLVAACGRSPEVPVSPVGPTASVSAATNRSPVVGALTASIAANAVIAFPPRNEPFDFRNQLEAKYRDGLRRPTIDSHVDVEGDVVWITEYFRYRLNRCGHADAISRVIAQLSGAGAPPVCGEAPSGTPSFPPRNEPMDFRLQLEAHYRDVLRRQPGPTHVDLEGDIVWVSEYLRYRLSNCSHDESVQRVFRQIDGMGVQAACGPPTQYDGTWRSGTTYEMVVENATVRSFQASIQATGTPCGLITVRNNLNVPITMVDNAYRATFQISGSGLRFTIEGSFSAVDPPSFSGRTPAGGTVTYSGLSCGGKTYFGFRPGISFTLRR